MKQLRYRPRYAIENQTLEGLYDVFDYEDGCIVSDKPMTFDDASAEAQRLSAPPKIDGGTFVSPDQQTMCNWLSALNFLDFEEFLAPNMRQITRDAAE